MTVAEGIYLLIYGILAFALATAVVIGFGIFLHAEKRLGHWIAPLFAPLIVLGIAAGSLLSRRNLTYASLDIESINAIGGGGGGLVLRLISFTLVGISGAKIFGWMLNRKRYSATGGTALFFAFVAYFVATVVLNSAFGTYPAFIHTNYYFLAVASAIYIARAERLDIIVKLARTALLCFLALSLLVAVAKPSLAIQPSYKGWIPGLSIRLWGLGSNPNSIGPLALLFLLLHYMQPYARKWMQVAGVGAALLVLVLAQSKTAWVAGAAAASVLLWHRYGRRADGSFSTGFLLFLIAMMISTTLAAFAIDPDRIWQRIAMTQAGTDIQTLTGRAQIWAAALDAWRTNPIFGYGPTAWGIEHRYRIGMPFAFSAHNQFVQTLSVGGMLGLTTLVVYFFLLGIGSWRAMAVTRGVSFTFFVIVVMRALTETPLSIGTLLNGDSIAHLILFAIALRGFSAVQSNVLAAASIRLNTTRQVAS
jgi:O-antigen ligase